MILLDTNILIHGNQPNSPNFGLITKKLLAFATDEEDLIICPQVLYEFYVVTTRPVEMNGLGISYNEAINKIEDLRNTYNFLNDPDDLFIQWHQLINEYKTIGKAAHDARLVAFMQCQKIDTIYTMNHRHFMRYSGIITIV